MVNGVAMSSPKFAYTGADLVLVIRLYIGCEHGRAFAKTTSLYCS